MSQDPLDNAPDVPAAGASKEEIAIALYDTVVTMLAALRTPADETAAKNFVSITLSGFRAPFDRIDVVLIRPGGEPPSTVAKKALMEQRELLDLLRRAYAALIDGKNTAMVCREIDEVLRENGVLT